MMRDNIVYNGPDNEVMVRTNDDYIYIKYKNTEIKDISNDSNMPVFKK